MDQLGTPGEEKTLLEHSWIDFKKVAEDSQPVKDPERDETKSAPVVVQFDEKTATGSPSNWISLKMKRKKQSSCLGESGMEAFTTSPWVLWKPTSRGRRRIGTWLSQHAKSKEHTYCYRIASPGSQMCSSTQSTFCAVKLTDK